MANYEKVPTIDSGVYRHNKSGRLYTVIGVAQHTENGNYVVVYRPNYESEQALYVRPYEMFVERIDDGTGRIIPRFEKATHPDSYLA